MNLSGIGQGAAAQGANLSSTLGANIGAARMSGGNNLAGIYQDAGNTRAQLQLQGGSAINNAIQGGLGNYLAINQQNTQNAQMQAQYDALGRALSQSNQVPNQLAGVGATLGGTPVVGYNRGLPPY
jgi:hypothetical protein